MKVDFDDFLAYISSEKGLSTNTINAYRRDIKRFIDFIQGMSITSFEQVKRSDIEIYLSQLNLILTSI